MHRIENRGPAATAHLAGMTPAMLARAVGCRVAIVRQAAANAAIPLPPDDDTPLAGETADRLLAVLGCAAGVNFICR